MRMLGCQKLRKNITLSALLVMTFRSPPLTFENSKRWTKPPFSKAKARSITGIIAKDAWYNIQNLRFNICSKPVPEKFSKMAELYHYLHDEINLNKTSKIRIFYLENFMVLLPLRITNFCPWNFEIGFLIIKPF